MHTELGSLINSGASHLCAGVVGGERINVAQTVTIGRCTKGITLCCDVVLVGSSCGNEVHRI